MSKKESNIKRISSQNAGKKLLSWYAPDYHPYEKGIVWYTIFLLFIFGCSVFFIFWDPEWGWVSAFTFCFVAAVYIMAHKDGHKMHHIEITERCLLFDDVNCFPWRQFKGYWIMDDHGARVIHFEIENVNFVKRITLQLEDTDEKKLEKAMEKVKMKHLEDQEEHFLELWSRVFKL